jgi:gas vesicle protein
LRKTDQITLFVAGAGVGLAVSLLLAPEAGGKTRRRIRDVASRAGDVLKKRAQRARDAGTEVLDDYSLTQEETSKIMSDLKDKAKDKVADAADAVGNAAEQVIDKSKDVACVVGKKIEKGGQRLQDA